MLVISRLEVTESPYQLVLFGVLLFPPCMLIT